MDNDRAFTGRLSDQTARPYAAVVVLALVGIIGLGLATRDDVNVSPAASPGSRAVGSPVATPSPRISLGPTLPPSSFRGLIALPPVDADPSIPETGELVERYPAAGGGLPYRGTARLYADGRLIWNRYFDGPRGPNSLTTGYLEQRLTPEGIEIVRRETFLERKAPLNLLQWLPPDAWKVRWPIRYVPSGYGICLYAEDARPGGSVEGVTIGPAQLVAMLPSSVSGLLTGRAFVSSTEGTEECISLSLDEARVLDQVLRDGDFEQDAFTNHFMVQYAVDVTGGNRLTISISFEPKFPDGSIGCSACG